MRNHIEYLYNALKRRIPLMPLLTLQKWTDRAKKYNSTNDIKTDNIASYLRAYLLGSRKESKKCIL